MNIKGWFRVHPSCRGTFSFFNNARLNVKHIHTKNYIIKTAIVPHNKNGTQGDTTEQKSEQGDEVEAGVLENLEE